MSFSSDVKKELCTLSFDCDDCRKAEIFGFLMCCRDRYVLLSTGSNSSARRLATDIVGYSNAIVDISMDLVYKNGKRHFTVCIPDATEQLNVFDSLAKYIPKNECCKSFVLRGVFLAGGTITDPQKDYHAEFSVGSQENAELIVKLLADFGIKSKITLRGATYIIYVKGSESIEDLLGLLGALSSYWKILEAVVQKDLRNKANRVANCDAANIGRTVAAASKQIEAIIKIREKIGFDDLPDELREIAEIRLENPELSLREIGGLLSSPISRSGVNHRLQKLIDIAEDLQE